MSAQKPVDLEALRERYRPTIVPPCRVCGGELSIAAIGGGQPTRWACGGRVDNPERPGYSMDAPGRWSNAPPGTPSEYGPGGHYHDSEWVDRRQGGDPSVIAILDELIARRARDAVASFQSRVAPWMAACFGDAIASDVVERCDRFVEEAIELTQSLGHSAERAHALVDYVYGRPKGGPEQEVGGVMVTLAALCLATGCNMHAAGEAELVRIWIKIDQIREKQAAKPAGSALPVATERRARDAAITELTATMEWYAGLVEGCRRLGTSGDACRETLAADGGKRARRALLAVRGGAK